MKHRSPSRISEDERFKSRVRHYHRAEPQSRRTWDEWVDGPSGRKRLWPVLLKATVILLVLIVLGALITGLILTL
jgi:hypothetical protein